MAPSRDMDLTDVGQRIKGLGGPSNADTLNGMISIGLQVMQNLYATKKQETRADLTSALSSTSAPLKNVDYTQSELDMEIGGKTVNVYDWQHDIAQTAIEHLEQYKDNPMFKKKRGDIETAINEFTAVLAYQDSMKSQRVEHLGNLETLHDKMIALVKSDPSMTDRNTWENWLAMYKDTETAYTNLEHQSGKKIPADAVVKYKALAQRHDLLAKGIQVDIDRDMPGFQIATSNVASPYLEAFFKQQGMMRDEGTTMGPEGEQITYMPESISGDITGPPEDIYQLPSIDEYKNALSSFNKYQLVDVARQADKLIKKEAAAGMEDFEVIRNWMESGTAEQSMYGLYVGHELFADPYESNPYAGQLSKEDIERFNLDELRAKKTSGIYAKQFEAMQTDFINMQKTIQAAKDARQQLQGKTIDDLDDVSSENIRQFSDNLNKEINRYNKRTKSDVLTVSDFTTNMSSTKGAKSLHVDVLQAIIDADHSEEWLPGTSAWQEEPDLKKFQDAAGTAKWVAMRKLVETYLDEEGEPFNEALAREVWDAEGLRSGEGKERYDLFYATLRSFRELMLADPYGTIITPQTVGD